MSRAAGLLKAGENPVSLSQVVLAAQAATCQTAIWNVCVLLRGAQRTCSTPLADHSGAGRRLVERDCDPGGG